MDKPVDMKLTKADRKADTSPTIAGGSTQKYPWGLELRLDDTSLKKLGMTEVPDVGVLCQVIGVGRVVSASERQSSDGTSRSVEIQIERLNLAVEDEDGAFESGVKKGRGRGDY